MTDGDRIARNRWLALVGTRLAGTAGAVFGLVLLGRAVALPDRLIGLGIVLAAMYMMAVVPRALARRWRTSE